MMLEQLVISKEKNQIPNSYYTQKSISGERKDLKKKSLKAKNKNIFMTTGNRKMNYDRNYKSERKRLINLTIFNLVISVCTKMP
jgi:hypothetical protein